LSRATTGQSITPSCKDVGLLEPLSRLTMPDEIPRDCQASTTTPLAPRGGLRAIVVKVSSRVLAAASSWTESA
jgi:hypothetical protein